MKNDLTGGDDHRPDGGVELKPVQEVDVGDGGGQGEHGVSPHDLLLHQVAHATGGAVGPTRDILRLPPSMQVTVQYMATTPYLPPLY